MTGIGGTALRFARRRPDGVRGGARSRRDRRHCRPSMSSRPRRSAGGESTSSNSPGRRLADQRAGDPDLQRYHRHADARSSGSGRHRRQRVGQRVPARRQLSRLRRDAGQRNAHRPRRLSEWRAHQRGLRRHGQLGPHSRQRDRQDDDRGGQPDLRPQRARRRAQRDDEERIYLAGASRRICAAVRSIAPRSEVQFGKQVGDWSIYMAGRRSATAAGGSTAPRRSTGSTATSATGRTASKSHLQMTAAEQPVRRGRLDADPATAEQLEQRLHRRPRQPPTRWRCSRGPAITPGRIR